MRVSLLHASRDQGDANRRADFELAGFSSSRKTLPEGCANIPRTLLKTCPQTNSAEEFSGSSSHFETGEQKEWKWKGKWQWNSEVDRLPVSVAATAGGGVATRELQAQKPKEKADRQPQHGLGKPSSILRKNSAPAEGSHRWKYRPPEASDSSDSLWKWLRFAAVSLSVRAGHPARAGLHQEPLQHPRRRASVARATAFAAQSPVRAPVPVLLESRCRALRRCLPSWSW